MVAGGRIFNCNPEVLGAVVGSLEDDPHPANRIELPTTNVASRHLLIAPLRQLDVTVSGKRGLGQSVRLEVSRFTTLFRYESRPCS
jgi:hypothetical protein